MVKRVLGSFCLEKFNNKNFGGPCFLFELFFAFFCFDPRQSGNFLCLNQMFLRLFLFCYGLRRASKSALSLAFFRLISVTKSSAEGTLSFHARPVRLLNKPTPGLRSTNFHTFTVWFFSCDRNRAARPMT